MNREWLLHVLRSAVSGFLAMTILLGGVTVLVVLHQRLFVLIPGYFGHPSFELIESDTAIRRILQMGYILVINGLLNLYFPFRLFKLLFRFEQYLDEKTNRFFPKIRFEEVVGKIGEGLGIAVGMTSAVIGYFSFVSIVL